MHAACQAVAGSGRGGGLAAVEAGWPLGSASLARRPGFASAWQVRKSCLLKRVICQSIGLGLGLGLDSTD